MDRPLHTVVIASIAGGSSSSSSFATGASATSTARALRAKAVRRITVNPKVSTSAWASSPPPLSPVCHYSDRICKHRKMRTMLTSWNDCCYSCGNSSCPGSCTAPRIVIASFTVAVSSATAEIGA